MYITKEVAPHFEEFIFDWNYETYLSIGGYGSGKSYNAALKIILKCLQERRKVLVLREVYDTIHDSCFDLIKEILEDLNLLADEERKDDRRTKVRCKSSPLKVLFPNGSKIIFKGMDKPKKIKSLNGVSIVWLEECSEIKYEGYKEMLGRIRTLNQSMHFILTCNPVSKENWVYRHFFVRIDSNGKEKAIINEEQLYKEKKVIKNDTYIYHSTLDDNPYLPKKYIKRIDEIKEYDRPLYRVARWGRFGPTGKRVFPQFKVAKNAKKFKRDIELLGIDNMRFGFDFGFETSFNAVVSCSVDVERGILYIWDEIYKNHITDDLFAKEPKMQAIKNKLNNYNDIGFKKTIKADSAEPKAIQYYKQQGFPITPCIKFAGSRLESTRKMKRFKKIICSPKCKNVISELKDLTYATKPNGDVVYDKFNIDPHTLSALWYALGDVTVANPKPKRYNSKTGSVDYTRRLN